MNKVALFAIIGTAMFLLGGGTAFATTPSGAVHIQPNPMMNANITWNTYNSSWAPLEYNNGTAFRNLTANFSPYYANPISVNTGDIKPYTLDGKYAGANFFNASQYSAYYPINNFALKNNSNGLILTGNASSTQSLYDFELIKLSWAQMPSQNYNYIYITASLSLSSNSGGATIGTIAIANSTESGSHNLAQPSTEKISAGQSMYISESLAQIIEGSGINVNSTDSPYIYIGLYLFQPAGSTTDTPIATLTMNNFALTTYPIILGQNSSGSKVSQAINTADLSQFAPTVPMIIQNSGYTVAVSQPLQNLTTQQYAISNGNYIEQVEYQGQFDLRSAPDLTYGPANLTETFNISTSQTQVLDINGVSYLSTISGKNGTIQLLNTVNPNSQIQFLQIVDYTQGQWNSISNSPGLFTLAGIEYYWWIAVGGLATLIGLGGAAKHAGTKADQERIRRGR